MAIEIELKAHVGDSEALKLLLMEKAEYQRAFQKEDTYWIKDTNPPPTGLKVRVRREKRDFPDGTKETVSLVTYKSKELRDGIEVNDEREFEIRSASGGSAEFEELLKRTGFKPDISKRKQGWLFIKEDLSAELAEVAGLGWFVELEILADNNREETVAQGEKRLLDFLTGLGIEKKAIESRYYTEMLGELN